MNEKEKLEGLRIDLKKAIDEMVDTCQVFADKSPSEPEPQFRVGDVVEVNGEESAERFCNEYGKIIVNNPSYEKALCIEFQNPRPLFHNGERNGRNKHCWWVREDIAKVVYREPKE